MIQRYEMTEVGSPYQPWQDLKRNDNGEWVLYEDVIELEKKNTEMKNDLTRLEKQNDYYRENQCGCCDMVW